MSERLEQEAASAWAHEIRRRTGDTLARRVLTAATLVAGTTALLGVSSQLSESTAHRWVGWLGGLLALSLLLGVWRSVQRSLARAEAMAARAREQTQRSVCPRCSAPREVVVGRAREHLCPRCGAHLLEAGGLLVLAVSSPWWRVRRWRSAARSRLGPEPRRLTLTSPIPWLVAALLGVIALGTLGTWLGTGAAPGTLEAGGGLGPSIQAEAQDAP